MIYTWRDGTPPPPPPLGAPPIAIVPKDGKAGGRYPDEWLGRPEKRLKKQEQNEFIKHFEFTESHIHQPYQRYDYIILSIVEVVVSDRFRQCVERLEPGRHQFLPLTLSSNRSDLEDLKLRAFYLLNCCEHVNFIDLDRTHMLVTDYPFIGRQYRFESDPPKLFAKSATIAGHHLWKAPRNMGNRLYYSQQLRDSFCEAGIDPGYFHSMEEV